MNAVEGQGRPGALVTGAGRRLGRAIAEALAHDGWRVCVHFNHSADDAEDVCRRIAADGGIAVAVGADLADPSAAEGLVARAEDAVGPLGCLVNNASLFEYDGPKRFDADRWHRHMAVNLTAPALLARDFAARVPDGEQGCVVHLLDQKLWNLNPDFFSYTVSKIGLYGVLEMTALAYAPRVRVCGVAPGLILPSGKMTEESFEKAHDKTPLRYGPTVGEIVQALRFILATPSFNGQVITVDGGESLQRRLADVQFEDRPGGAAS